MTKTIFALALGAALLGGCGDDDAVTVDTGVDESKRISELSPSEVAQVCNELERVSGEFLDLSADESCELSAVVASEGNGEMCETRKQECLDAEVDAGAGDDDDDGFECGLDEMETCEATIGEMEACFNELSSRIHAVTELSCASSASEVETAYGRLAPLFSGDFAAICPDVASKPGCFEEDAGDDDDDAQGDDDDDADPNG